MVENLIKTLGYLYYWGIMIWWFFDNDYNTPSSLWSDLRPWDGWEYYLAAIVTYILFYPIWYWIMEIVGGAIGESIDEWIEEKLK